MADANSPEEWQEAKEQLREEPHELPGMTDEVLYILKFSFDRLRDDATKQCLLYCCLFPEDYEIPVEQVIEYWVGEGFLESVQSSRIIRARNRGHGMITKLKSACLLETAEDDFVYGKPRVKMHDVVREMCLWLTGGDFVRGRSERWGDAKRISLIHHGLESLPQSVPSCPNLQTLLAYRCSFYEICGGIFEFMPALRVLDLSCTELSSLPEEIGFLIELQYLNLKATRICSLPKGLGKLAKLRQLNLDETFQLRHIPRGVLPTLVGLQILGLFQSSIWKFNELSGSLTRPEILRLLHGATLHFNDNIAASPSLSSVLVSLKDNESCWKRLEELRVTVWDALSLETLLKCDNLGRCTIDLQLCLDLDLDIMTTHVRQIFRRLEKLRKFWLCSLRERTRKELVFDSTSKCSSLEELKLLSVSKISVVAISPCLFPRLRILVIQVCHGIHDLTWVRQLPSLEVIVVFQCARIEELLSAEAHACDYSSSLRKLKTMRLDNLPSLKSISNRPLPLPALKYLHVRQCPQLKKLPLGLDSAQNIQTIEAEEEWWEGLEWYHDDQSIKLRSFLNSGPIKRDFV